MGSWASPQFGLLTPVPFPASMVSWSKNPRWSSPDHNPSSQATSEHEPIHFDLTDLGGLWLVGIRDGDPARKETLAQLDGTVGKTGVRSKA